MIQDVITRSVDSIWPVISLILFVVCFMGVFIWTYRGRKDRFRREASLPLDDAALDTLTGANHGDN